MKRRSPTRKHSFLLLEVLLSIALVALCLFPMVKTHHNIGRARAKQLEQITRTHLEQQALCEVKEKLFAHKYSWKRLQDPIPVRGTLDAGRYEFELSHARSHPTKKGMVLTLKLFHPKNKKEVAVQRTLYVERA